MRKQIDSASQVSVVGFRVARARRTVILPLCHAAMLVLLIAPQTVTAKSWNGGSGAWETGSNWTPTGAPGSTDDVSIDNGTVTVDLSSGVTIKSLTIGQTTSATLTFQNGDVSTKRLNVTGNVTIGPNGTLTHAANVTDSRVFGSETNRLRLDVGGNLTISASGKIDVTGMGYMEFTRQKGSGPGTTAFNSGGGAGYGGQGGSAAGGTTYGSVTNPVNNGSGGTGAGNGTWGTAGGGSAVISVGGLLTLSGAILADGIGGVPGESSGAGSGGSVNIRAGALAGSGTLSANGGALGGVGNGGGGGGRIAVVLTNVSDSAFAGLAAIRAFGGAGPGGAGAAGTVYLKGNNQTYGTLMVNNSSGSASRNTLYQTSTNQFDTIVTTNGARFALGTGAQLIMTGCNWLSDTSSEIIIVTGSGQIIAPALTIPTNATLAWSGTNDFSIISDVTVASGGKLTHEPLASTDTVETHKLIATIQGSLNVQTGATIYVTGLGFGLRNGPGASPAGSTGAGHGGEGAGPGGTTYDSVTNPVRAGSGTYDYNWTGGGVVCLRVSGQLTVNGTIAAEGQNQSMNTSHGSGGSVNIVAGSLAGAGKVSVNGGSKGSAAGTAAGGGGRIAMVLTNADDSAFSALAIQAYGGTNGTIAAAGTIYLKAQNQPYGRLIVDNGGQSGGAARTLISATVSDTTVGDVILRNNGYISMVGQTLTSYGSWSNAVATNALSGGTVVLAGATPATIWGGNTWSNLVITNRGKVVYFETNKVQTITGTPTFDNYVTLRSTVDGVRWILSKTSVGATQYVGKVSAKDSNATNDVFKTTGGSDLHHNYHWLFPASGTVVIMR
jgi:hypothetical protein